MKEIVKCCKHVGFVTVLVDDIDYERLLTLTNDTFFLKKNVRPYIKTNGYERQLAQEVIGIPPVGHTIDHIDRNPFNCQRHNLRFATPLEQSGNRGVRKDNKTGYKGVQLDKKTNKFFACLITGGKRYYSYGHIEPLTAALSYDSLVTQHQPHGLTNAKLGLI